MRRGLCLRLSSDERERLRPADDLRELRNQSAVFRQMNLTHWLLRRRPVQPAHSFSQSLGDVWQARPGL